MHQTELTLPHISYPAAQAPDQVPCGSNSIVATNPHIKNPAAQAPDLLPCGFKHYDDNRWERVSDSLLKVAQAGVKIDPEFDPRAEQGEKALVNHLKQFADEEKAIKVTSNGVTPGVSWRLKHGASVKHQYPDPVDNKISADFKAHCAVLAGRLPYIMVGLDNGNDEIHINIPAYVTYSGKQIRAKMTLKSFLSFGWYVKGMVLNWERPHAVVMNGESKSAPFTADDVLALVEHLNQFPGGSDMLIRLSNQWMNGALKITFAKKSPNSLKSGNQLAGDAPMAFMAATAPLTLTPFLENEKLRVIGHGGTLNRVERQWRDEEDGVTKYLDRFCTDPNAASDPLVKTFLSGEVDSLVRDTVEVLLDAKTDDTSRTDIERIIDEVLRYEWTNSKELGLSVRMTPIAAALGVDERGLHFVRTRNMQAFKRNLGFCAKRFQAGRASSNIQHQLLQKNLVTNKILPKYPEIGIEKEDGEGNIDPDSKAGKNRKRALKNKTSKFHSDVAKERQNCKRAMVILGLAYINAAKVLYGTEVPEHLTIQGHLEQVRRSDEGRRAR